MASKMRGIEKSNIPFTFYQLKKCLFDSGYEIVVLPKNKLEDLATGKNRIRDNEHPGIMGLIIPDSYLIGICSELSMRDRAITLLHEMIHLYDECMAESKVEQFTLKMSEKLTPNQIGLLEFFVEK